MFNWVKKLFGTESAVQHRHHTAETIVKSVVISTPPAPVKAKTAKPAAKKVAPKKAETKTAKHTKASLGKLTKVQIDELAKSDFGIDLDRRKTKDDMIKDFLAAQKK